MKENNNLVYGAVAIVAILVFVGAAIAIGMFSSPTYEVSLKLAGNNTNVLPIYPYQTTVFNITVTNNGGKEVVAMPVAFYLNGNQRNYSKFTIPAHQSLSVQESYTYTTPGGFLFSAAIDPGNVLNIANRSSTRKSIGVVVSAPQLADVYQSVVNSNIIYTDSFTTSGTGLLTGALMANLYPISSVSWINGGGDGGILYKVYQDVYLYVSVANGAYSAYANGSASYTAWLQGTLNPEQVGRIVSSFGKKVSLIGRGANSIEYSPISNTVSACSYYQGGWTKIIELYNDSNGGNCLAVALSNYTPTESNAIAAGLKGTRMGSFLTANQLNATKEIQWSHFYYNNATVLGQMVEYGGNTIAAATLFQLQHPTGVFLSRITSTATNVMAVNSTCLGLNSVINGTSFCSEVLSTNGIVGNQSYGTVYTKFISSNYIAEVYSLIGMNNLTAAHANAGELISRLGIKSSSVKWTSIFRNDCAFESGFRCIFNNIEANGSVNMTITNINYSSVKLDNITCAMGVGAPAMVLNGTLAQGQNITVLTPCHSLPTPAFAAEIAFGLKLGFNYHNIPTVVNGTLNLTGSGG